MYLYGDFRWQDVVKLSTHFAAIGQLEVYVSSRQQDYPWQYVNSCEAGGSHRLDIATSVTFKAAHPCGLTFRWSWDLELPQSNGKGHYEINVPGCRQVLAKLPPLAAEQFRAYLRSCVEPVEKRGLDYDEAARQQFGMAQQLRRASEPEFATAAK